MQEVAVGSYTGNGAAQNIELGFTPDYVKVWNATDGDDSWEWFNGMAAASAFYERNVVDNGVTGNSSKALITANGITAYAGSTTVGRGLTIGTALSEIGKTFRYLALRARP